MESIVYTLKIKTDTQEMHLFEATPKSGNECIPNSKSICKKMYLSESSGNKFACYNEEKARTTIASLGRKVCGTCTSHLYTTY